MCCLALAIVVALPACESANSRQAPSQIQVIGLDSEVTLAPAMTVAVSGGPEIQFVAVSEDSRCPSDTTCVWAGEVKVQLAVRTASDSPGKHESWGAHEVTEANSVDIAQHRIFVVKVLPYPTSAKKIPREDYRVTLKVDKV